MQISSEWAIMAAPLRAARHSLKLFTGSRCDFRSVGNDYGHPHDETLEKLDAIGCDVTRTDLNGDITISTDGENGYYFSFEDAAA